MRCAAVTIGGIYDTEPGEKTGAQCSPDYAMTALNLYIHTLSTILAEVSNDPSW